MVAVSRERANGAPPAVVDLPDRVGGQRSVRTPELAVGVLLVVGCALAATLLFLQADRKQPVAAFASAVRAGDVIEHSDLRVIYVSSDGELATVSPDAASTYVGKRALRDVARGSLLTPDGVGDGPALAPGEGVVGVAIGAGAVPTSTLAVGDLVNVVTSAGDTGAGAGEAVLVEGAAIHAVEEADVDGTMIVSLRTSIAAANRVAAAEPTKLRLVLVAR